MYYESSIIIIIITTIHYFNVFYLGLFMYDCVLSILHLGRVSPTSIKLEPSSNLTLT